MKRSWLLTAFLLAMTGFAAGSALAEPVLVDDTTQQFDSTVPATETPPPDVPAVAPIVAPAPVEAPKEDKTATPVDAKPGDAKREESERGRGRDRDRPDRDRPGRGDDKDDDKKPHRPSHGKPHRPPPRVVYIYPNNYRVIERTEIYTNYPAQAEGSTIYPNGYIPPYQVGDYLPNNRQWFKLPDYDTYGLTKPRVGEEWVFNDRDVILLSTATGKILSAITLAASIQ